MTSTFLAKLPTLNPVLNVAEHNARYPRSSYLFEEFADPPVVEKPRSGTVGKARSFDRDKEREKEREKDKDKDKDDKSITSIRSISRTKDADEISVGSSFKRLSSSVSSSERKDPSAAFFPGVEHFTLSDAKKTHFFPQDLLKPKVLPQDLSEADVDAPLEDDVIKRGGGGR